MNAPFTKPSLIIVLLMLAIYSLPMAGAVKENPPIRVGSSADSLHDASVTDAEIAFNLIFNEILGDASESFNIKVYDSDSQLEEKLLNGELDAIFTNPLQYFELEKYLNPQATYLVQYGPKLKQEYYLIVRHDSGIKDITGLRGKVLSLSRGNSIGKLFLDVSLLKAGLPESDSFFSKIIRTRESNASVVSLFFGQVDAALIPDFSYELAKELNPQIEHAFTIIGKSMPLVYHTVSMSRNFPRERIAKFEPFILNIANTPRLRELSNTFRVNRIIKANDEAFKETRELSQDYIHLKSRLSKR